MGVLPGEQAADDGLYVGVLLVGLAPGVAGARAEFFQTR
jgi:hypothetical protein